ncbi:hypothetical protein [Amantichitinum ursilacus]|uniref:Uncharacterized protein n=1 Tax=Amantichitinum ursilacus TaxID=857265 RepID=A0A0N0GN31_9NEIS|nr:hypothetical protein [Amantichitinum ursilacus]KPC52321.1 hypothetical protein WG78_14720 [Amantichitinum ursilacus]
MIVHRNAGRVVWWLVGVVLVIAAIWGWPLITTPTLEHHFYGLFWYTMLGLGAAFWMFPAEQTLAGRHLRRRTMLLGLLPVYTREIDLAAFDRVTLEQDRSTIGADSLWVLFAGPDDQRFVFAHYRATRRGQAAATALAGRLAQQSGLAFAQLAPDNG